MFARRTYQRLFSIVVVGLGLVACGSDPRDEEEATTGEVSSELPLGAFSEANASFAGLGLGGAAATSTIGTTSTLGGAVGTGGTLGAGGFGTSFGTGPISTGTSFSTGPITMSTGGGMSVSSGSGSAPVITTSCVGFGCP